MSLNISAYLNSHRRHGCPTCTFWPVRYTSPKGNCQGCGRKLPNHPVSSVRPLFGLKHLIRKNQRRSMLCPTQLTLNISSKTSPVIGEVEKSPIHGVFLEQKRLWSIGYPMCKIPTVRIRNRTNGSCYQILLFTEWRVIDNKYVACYSI